MKKNLAFVCGFDPQNKGAVRLDGWIRGWQATSMNLEELRDSLRSHQPPQELNAALSGLWWDAKGDWTRAHESAQQDEGPAGAWVHAYLHRKEGDSSNAAYWYQRAGQPPCHSPLEEEWAAIAEALLR